MRFSRITVLILIGNGLLSLGYYYFVVSTISSEQTQLIRLEQLLALTALVFLYASLSIKPLLFALSVTFSDLFKSITKGCITSAWYYGLLHGLLAFFGQLGGFAGLGFLTGRYLLAVILSGLSLIMLTCLAISFLPPVQTKLADKLKTLGNVILYVIGVSIMIHAVLLGTHFQDLGQRIPQVLACALVLFFLLESQRLDWFLEKKYSFPRFGISFVIVVGGIIRGIFLVFSPQQQGIPSLSIHSQHIQIAKQAFQDTTQIPNIPGMKGDKTRRFSIDIDAPKNIAPNTEVTLQFTVYEASNGKQVELFDTVYEKLLHLVVVDQKLSYFSHIHPDLEKNTFTIKTTFPHDGLYHLFLDFQPLGAIEQQFAFTIAVGNVGTNENVEGIGDTRVAKDVGRYEVTMNRPMHLESSLISVGQQEISFNVKNKDTHSPVTTLKPYLAAFGHLVMINTRTYDYVHVHPTITVPPKSNDNGGPDIRFMPLGLYGPIKPGTYKAFLQINPDNTLLTTDFMVEIE